MVWGKTQSSFFAYRTMDGGLWHCTGGRDQDHHQEKEMEKAKWLSKEALQIAWEEKQEAKEKRKDIPIWKKSSKEKQGEIRKPSSVISARNRGKQQNGKD